GFGKGLTPDGDDYLLGYLAALWLWQLPAPLADHQYRLQQALDQHAHNTTDISRHYLERALQGHFSEPICQLLAQLVGSAS
ncbi:oxamate carbamoyltransferase subunit AllH family protein, partial [Escherichia coli]|uniref:oxamate carbamoyltransferase subunit AllH family protein n=1 Tax=Escherichia coli TaxID=562 RepID=UPI001118B894